VDIIWEMRMPMRAQHAAATRSVCVNSQHSVNLSRFIQPAIPTVPIHQPVPVMTKE